VLNNTGAKDARAHDAPAPAHESAAPAAPSLEPADAVLIRFLRGSKYDVKRAASRYESYVAARADLFPGQAVGATLVPDAEITEVMGKVRMCAQVLLACLCEGVLLTDRRGCACVLSCASLRSSLSMACDEIAHLCARAVTGLSAGASARHIEHGPEGDAVQCEQKRLFVATLFVMLAHFYILFLFLLLVLLLLLLPFSGVPASAVIASLCIVGSFYHFVPLFVVGVAFLRRSCECCHRATSMAAD
jgi:hypothetical protein